MTAWLRLLPRAQPRCTACGRCSRRVPCTTRAPGWHRHAQQPAWWCAAAGWSAAGRWAGLAGCPAWHSVTAACPASGLTGPTCASSVTCGRSPGPAGGFLRYAWHPERKAWPLLQNELLASGLYRYALSRDGVPVKRTERRLPREPPPGTVTWRASQPTVTPAVPAHPTQARRTLTTEGSPFPGGQIHRRRPKVCGGCTKPHARIPRPRTRV